MDELRKIYSDKGVGERFDFGRWPQGPNGEVEPITWRVIAYNSDGSKKLLADKIEKKKKKAIDEREVLKIRPED